MSFSPLSTIWRPPSPPKNESPFAPVATLMRGGQAESWHVGAAAVVAPGGRLIAALGDPHLATFIRSAAKPFQVLPLLLGGGEERFRLETPDLALICASHGGRDAHVERAASLLERGGFTTRDLLCGVHRPFDEEAARRLKLRGGEPTPLHNNCSGKHSGMLLACRLLDLPPVNYVDFDHPLQQEIRSALASVAGMNPADVALGIDGCSAPSFHLPLAAAARAYAALADPEAAGINAEVAAALRRVAAAMTAAPEMVAGPGRFTTRLMEVTAGRVIGKEGAEGVYALAIRGPVALGAVLKIADGGERARDGVVLDLLRQLGALSASELEELDGFYRPLQHNHRGLLVGEIVPDIELEEVPDAS